MIEFLTHNMAPIMFGALVVFLLLGYPVAFALAANGIFFGLIGVELGMLEPSLFQALPQDRLLPRLLHRRFDRCVFHQFQRTGLAGAATQFLLAMQPPLHIAHLVHHDAAQPVSQPALLAPVPPGTILHDERRQGLLCCVLRVCDAQPQPPAHRHQQRPIPPVELLPGGLIRQVVQPLQ